MQCVVLAGGLAQRMRPLTETIPKSLLPVAEHPFIHYQLTWLASHGVDEVVLCVGYLGEQIREYVGDGAAWNLRVRYVDEGRELRGTGGALRLAFEQGHLASSFLLTYGDSFLPIDFAEVWRAFRDSGADSLMTVLHNEGRWDTSNACFRGGKIVVYDKQRQERPGIAYDHIDYGLLALRRDVIADQVPPNQRYDLATLFHELSLEGRLAGFEVKTRFYEIGSRDGLQDFNRYIAEGGRFSRQSELI
jgi:NDP-sugar pyrophosphorylase family protein